MNEYISIYIGTGAVIEEQWVGQADFIEGSGGIGDPGSSGYDPWA